MQVDLLIDHEITAIVWQSSDIQEVVAKHSVDGITWHNVTDEFGNEKVNLIEIF